MIYRSLALAGMAIFYILYFFKLFSQKKKGIDTYKLGKKSDKKKALEGLFQAVLRDGRADDVALFFQRLAAVRHADARTHGSGHLQVIHAVAESVCVGDFGSEVIADP